MLTKEKIAALIHLALTEDLGEGDITSATIIPKRSRAEGHIIAKAEGVLCGTDIAREVFKTVDKNIAVKILKKDGTRVRPDTKVVAVKGPARSVLAGERVALNFMSRLSGISTLTSQFVARCNPYKTKILDTRKTTPGLRAFEKYAVRVGGGQNHRLGLWHWVLIKDNHLEAIYHDKAVETPVSKAIDKAKKAFAPSTTIEIEVDNMHDLRIALTMHPDIIMLDNMNLTQIKKAIKLRNNAYKSPKRKRPKLEVSGNVSLRRVAQLAKNGVDYISIGALTHSARALDFSLDIKPI